MSVTEHQQQQQQPEEPTNMKGFIFFWSGQMVSILGSSVIQFVLTWWITVQTESPFMLALATFIAFVPTIILTPVAGVLVDRWNRKAIIAIVDFLQAAVTLVLLFLFWFTTVTVAILLVFLAVRGIFQAFHQPAVMSLTPIMVPRKQLSRINSLDYFFNSIIFLIGPIIAAFLYKYIPIHHIMWIDVASFIIAVIPLIFVVIPKVVQPEKEEGVEKKSFWSDFKEGFVFIKNKEGLLPLLGSFTGANFFVMPLFTLLNLFVYTTHNGIETNLAFVLAFNQVGMIIGSILFLVWKGFKKKVNGVIIGIALMYAGYLFMSLTPTGLFWFMGIGFLIIGFGLPMANISSQTIWQSVVPKEKLGRVMSVRIAIAQFTSPLAIILSGVITEGLAKGLSNNISTKFANGLSIQIVLMASAVIGMIFLAFSWFLTNMRNVEKGIIFIDDKPSKPEDEIESMLTLEELSDASSKDDPTNPQISI
ncbi:MAG: MFS transporter [Candidatus Heimdallarchaeota archaeon]